MHHFTIDCRSVSITREKKCLTGSRLANIFSQLRATGSPVPDLEMKHRAMILIADAQTWGAMAHLLGTGDGISFRQWQAAMLKKEEEFDQNGVMSGQTLANELYRKREENEGVFQATTIHQTFRGQDLATGEGVLAGTGEHSIEVEEE